jgi:hypothetical protein
MASRPGKMPTMSVRRLTSLFSRSWVVGPDLPPDLAGEGGEREDVVAGVVEVRGGLRQSLASSASTTWACWARTEEGQAARRWCGPGWTPTAGRSWAPG